MTRLSRLFLMLMLVLATFSAVEPAVASAHPEPVAAVHMALPCHSEPLSQKHVPASHVCCASNLAAPASFEAPMLLRTTLCSPEDLRPVSRLPGLTTAPGSPPPRA